MLHDCVDPVDLCKSMIDLTAQLVGSVRPDLPKEMHRLPAFILMGILTWTDRWSRRSHSTPWSAISSGNGPGCFDAILD